MRTLRNEIKISGVGLHSGEHSTLWMRPCERAGIYFRKNGVLSSTAKAVVEEDQRLTGFRLPNGALVRTGEHLLAAIAGMGLDSVELELSAAEVPIMDGSARPYADAIRECGFEEIEGTVKRRAISSPIFVEENGGNRLLIAAPSDKLSITYIIDYSKTPIGVQKVRYDITEDTFYNIISRARTFALTYELDYLKQNGLAKGGSLENAIVFDEKGPVYGQTLRFPLECVTHKVIDLLGDLTLAGEIPTAHYVAIAAGHSIHGKLTRRIKSLFS